LNRGAKQLAKLLIEKQKEGVPPEEKSSEKLRLRMLHRFIYHK